MSKVCLECRAEYSSDVCPECGSSESVTSSEDGSRQILLKVSSSVYSEYRQLCEKMGLNPEPGCNFESDDDVRINIESLQEELSRRKDPMTPSDLPDRDKPELEKEGYKLK